MKNYLYFEFCLTKRYDCGIIIKLNAGVMELADVSDSKSDGSDTVPVRPRSPAPNFHGLVAQLGERCVRNAEVEGSNPFRSMEQTFYKYGSIAQLG